MTNVQLAAWVATIGVGAVIVAFVGAEGFLYFLRVRKLARMSREPYPGRHLAGQVPAADTRGVSIPVPTGAPFVARRPGGVARSPVVPPPGPVIDPK